MILEGWLDKDSKNCRRQDAGQVTTNDIGERAREPYIHSWSVDHRGMMTDRGP